MKYAILAVIVLFMVSTTVCAEEASVGAQVESVLDKVGEKANSVMDSLAERFGTTASEGFGALEGYYARRGYMLLGMAIFLFIFSVTMIWRGAWQAQHGMWVTGSTKDEGYYEQSQRDSNQNFMQGLGIFFMILGTGALIPFGICIYHAIDFISGPRRHAIREVMNMLQ